ncbi:MAG: FlgD immunoglobulin-like domain containing protein [Candidatus Krumholzibacteriia bacterium]
MLKRALLLVTLSLTVSAAPVESADSEWTTLGRWAEAPITKIAVGSGLVFSVAGDDAIRVLDVRDPGAPVDLGVQSVAFTVADMALHGDVLCVAAGEAGLRLLDVSATGPLTELGHVDGIGVAERLAIADDIAYVITADDALVLVSIADPERPAILSEFATATGATDVYVAEGHAYVSWFNDPQGDWIAQYRGLQVIDVQDPAVPRSLGQWEMGFGMGGIAVRDGIAYYSDFCDYNGGCFSVMAMGEPFWGPNLAAFHAPFVYLAQVRLGVHVVYVADWHHGVHAYDITEPENCRELEFFPTQQPVRDMEVVDGTVYVADGDLGLIIARHVGEGASVDLPAGVPFRLQQNHPNPFNPSTTIPFTLAAPGRVTVEIVDVAGRRMRTLLRNVEQPEGPNQIHWNGRDDAGRPLASGVYFARLTLDGDAEQKKMLLIK